MKTVGGADPEAAEVREAEAARAGVVLAEAGTDAGAPVGDMGAVTEEAAAEVDAHTKGNLDRIKGQKKFCTGLSLRSCQIFSSRSTLKIKSLTG